MLATVPLIQFGLGGVGRALLDQVLASREAQARHGIELRYMALADSRSALIGGRGLDDETLRAASAIKGEGGWLSELPRAEMQRDLLSLIEALGPAPAIVVDTTAAPPDRVLPAFERVLDRGGVVVLANKKPLTADWASWERLTAGGRTGYEATVGAGLPVIATLRHLLDTGDEVRRIEGVLSGTLGFLMSELEGGAPFAATVREARARGWTEPDPRDDLSGMDVARKALILARTLGHPVELADLPPAPLYPASWADLSLDQFLARLDDLDGVMAQRRDAAHSGGRRLRYAATISAERLAVGPLAIPPDTPLGALRGPDNLIAFHTARYSARPLVVQGAGAGTTVTASALLGDILRLSSHVANRRIVTKVYE